MIGIRDWRCFENGVASGCGGDGAPVHQPQAYARAGYTYPTAPRPVYATPRPGRDGGGGWEDVGWGCTPHLISAFFLRTKSVDGLPKIENVCMYTWFVCMSMYAYIVYTCVLVRALHMFVIVCVIVLPLLKIETKQEKS